ncbi:MAG: polysaccharide biosynthesis/export family protein [Pirellulaceae bacterium]
MHNANFHGYRPTICLLLIASTLLSSGCTAISTAPMATAPMELVTHPALAPQGEPILDANGQVVGQAELGPESPPTELSKVSLPAYRLAPPDVLMIQGVRTVPKSPYIIQSGDFLTVIVSNSLPEAPIQAVFQVNASGYLSLGGPYESVRVEGLTEEEATNAVAKSLSKILGQAQVALTVREPSGMQQIFGEHMLGLDGTINLGIYGTVYVAGMTVNEARAAVENHLSEFLNDPKVSLDVVVFNSKFYYVVAEGAGLGEQVIKVPVTGNETVLDAIAQIGGLQQFSSKKIWISRPAPKDMACDQILPVDWDAITKGASTATNYQVLPGDRVFVSEDRLVATSSFVSKVINPVERMFGFSLLGAQAFQFMQRFPRGSLFQ